MIHDKATLIELLEEGATLVQNPMDRRSVFAIVTQKNATTTYRLNNKSGEFEYEHSHQAKLS